MIEDERLCAYFIDLYENDRTKTDAAPIFNEDFVLDSIHLAEMLARNSTACSVHAELLQSEMCTKYGKQAMFWLWGNGISCPDMKEYIWTCPFCFEGYIDVKDSESIAAHILHHLKEEQLDYTSELWNSPNCIVDEIIEDATTGGKI